MHTGLLNLEKLGNCKASWFAETYRAGQLCMSKCPRTSHDTLD